MGFVLCFFDYAHQIPVNTDQQEYLLVKNFNIVFEAIIDELIGDKNLPTELKEQADGKRVDHLYQHYGLIENQDADKNTYYIGDSKYYKMGSIVGKESVYKQYTYARNVIQWNLDLFQDEDKNEKIVDGTTHYKLRDDITEGYNIIPNFFISADLPMDLSYTTDKIECKDSTESKPLSSYQFKNRLFDRDTLLLSHYNVNFLYVVSLYARDNQYEQASWKMKVRDMFREKVQSKLKNEYDFYAMTEKQKDEGIAYIRTHFQEVLGKIYTPFENPNIFSLALDKNDKDANETLKTKLEQYFIVKECTLGDNPENIPDLKNVEKGISLPNEKVLVMRAKDQNQLEWINKNHFYNIPLQNFNTKFLSCRALVLVLGKESFLYYITQEKHEVKSKIDLQTMGYVNPHSENYFLLHLDETKQSQRVQVNEPLYKNDYMIIDSNKITLINVEGIV